MIPFHTLKDWTGGDVVVDVGFAIWTSLICESLQHFSKHFQIQWLRYVRIKTSGSRARDVVVATEAGDGYDRHGRASVDLAQSLKKLKPIHLGHRDVGQDHVKLIFLRDAQRIRAVRRRGHLRPRNA